MKLARKDARQGKGLLLVVCLASVGFLELLPTALSVAAGARQSQDILPALVRRIKPSAVAIETFDNQGKSLSRGSGFFIDVDRVVTNRHVIENSYRVEVHSSNGSVYQVK